MKYPLALGPAALAPVALAALLLPTAHGQATLFIVPEATPQAGSSALGGIAQLTRDGRSDVRTRPAAGSATEAIRFAPSVGAVPLPATGYASTRAYNVSESGDYVLGQGNGPLGTVPLRWSGLDEPLALEPVPLATLVQYAGITQDGQWMCARAFSLPLDQYLGSVLWDATGRIHEFFQFPSFVGGFSVDGTALLVSDGTDGSFLWHDIATGQRTPITPPAVAGFLNPRIVEADATRTQYGGDSRSSSTASSAVRVVRYDETASEVVFAPPAQDTGEPATRFVSMAVDSLVIAATTDTLQHVVWVPSLGTVLFSEYARELSVSFSGLGLDSPRIADLSGDGSVVAGSSYLLGQGTATEVGWTLVLPDGWWTEAGTAYCEDAAATSTGDPARTMAFGSPEVASTNFRLESHGVPRFSAAMYVVSPDVGAFQPPGSQGTLCLGGAIGRFNGPGEILDSREFGRVRLDVDLGALPGGPGGQTRAAQAGESWHFQLWFRDFGAAGPTSNFSNAVTVLVE